MVYGWRGLSSIESESVRLGAANFCLESCSNITVIPEDNWGDNAAFRATAKKLATQLDGTLSKLDQIPSIHPSARETLQWCATDSFTSSKSRLTGEEASV
jgi:hypothetical protein